MFHQVSNASKVALVELVARLRSRGFSLLDLQMITPVTESMGAHTVSRDEYLDRLRRALEASTVPPPHPPSIAREMDHWGITGGRLLEEAARLSLALRRLSDTDAP